MQYAGAVRTDIGRKRSGNEDAYCLAPELGLFLVADGMGGHAAGEVASRLAAETIQQAMEHYLGGTGEALVGPVPTDLRPDAAYLVGSLRLANRRIYDAAISRPEYEGMGTTVVALLARPERCTLAHVGDSRIYRVRGDTIAQLTHDHSFVQEQVDRGLLSATQAQVSQYRHMITRALGLGLDVEVDLQEAEPLPGDAWLLCSDGLSDLVEDEEMLAAVQAHPEPADACQALVDQANRRGGDDNITVLIVQARKAAPAAGVFTRLRELLGS